MKFTAAAQRGSFGTNPTMGATACAMTTVAVFEAAQLFAIMLFKPSRHYSTTVLCR